MADGENAVNIKQLLGKAPEQKPLKDHTPILPEYFDR